MLRRIALVAAIVLTVATNAKAQGPLIGNDAKLPAGTTSATFGGAYYNFSGRSGCDFLISVWGFVGNPGRYNVPCETDLLDLLSFCGGPLQGAYLDRVRIIRRGGVNDQDEIARVFEVDVQKYMQKTETPIRAQELLLFPRDLVIIDGDKSDPVDYVLRIAQVIVAIASITTATVAIINISKD